MKINGSERETLSVMASCPFIDRLELANISGASRSAVYDAVGGLEDSGLIAHIPHAADLTPPTRRYLLTGKGLGTLAEAEGANLDDLLRSRPVSVQWLRVLMDRLDAPGRHIPTGIHRGQRCPPRRPAPVQGRSPRRRHDPPRRAHRGDRQAGTRRRQDGILAAALEAAGRAEARNDPRPGDRRGAAETRPQDAAPPPWRPC